MKYGQKIIENFNVSKDLETWPNENQNDYCVHINLPELTCLCPRSGYPDFAVVDINYVPNKLVVELKAIKLYINSFINRHISHENIANEIYNTLFDILKPKYFELKINFNPRGNVHTIISINSNQTKQTQYKVIKNEF